MNAINKYLARYGEIECDALIDFPVINSEYSLVIPCYAEDLAFVERFRQSSLAQKPVLVVLVINEPESNSPTLDPQNQTLLRYFQKLPSLWRQRNLCLYAAPDSKTHWLIVDRCGLGRRIPASQGVGLARKIGCDLAVALHHRRALNSTWIYTTDADAHLPENYFQVPSEHYSAAVFSFHHQSGCDNDQALLRATQLYETALKYYVEGLRWAGSPYAFATVGSAFALNAACYCQVRGFPKRSAGEDFYMLNKLAKVGPVLDAKETTIKIDARLSQRVPFGTGPSVRKILDYADPDEQYCYYSPNTFAALKIWIEHMPSVWPALRADKDPLQTLPVMIRQILQEAGIEQLSQHIQKQISDGDACLNAIHQWFDAFQTLKFIRRVQLLAHPAVPLKQCLAEAPFSVNRQ